MRPQQPPDGSRTKSRQKHQTNAERPQHFRPLPATVRITIRQSNASLGGGHRTSFAPETISMRRNEHD
jgi:hypothetical protein